MSIQKELKASARQTKNELLAVARLIVAGAEPVAPHLFFNPLQSMARFLDTLAVVIDEDPDADDRATAYHEVETLAEFLNELKSICVHGERGQE